MDWNELVVVGATCAPCEALDLVTGSPIVLDRVNNRCFIARDPTEALSGSDVAVDGAEFERLAKESAIIRLPEWGARPGHRVVLLREELERYLACISANRVSFEPRGAVNACRMSGWTAYYVRQEALHVFRRDAARAVLAATRKIAPFGSDERRATDAALASLCDGGARRWPAT